MRRPEPWEYGYRDLLRLHEETRRGAVTPLRRRWRRQVIERWPLYDSTMGLVSATLTAMLRAGTCCMDDRPFIEVTPGKTLNLWPRRPSPAATAAPARR